jgi:hypothetical protein
MSDITQVKGKTVAVWGAIAIPNLDKEDSIAYDVGQSGDTYGTLNSVVHVIESAGSVISSVTIKIPKGSPEFALISAQAATGSTPPLIIRDSGVGLTAGMESANMTQVALTSTTGDSTKETASFTFKGNLALVAV